MKAWGMIGVGCALLVLGGCGQSGAGAQSSASVGVTGIRMHVPKSASAGAALQVVRYEVTVTSDDGLDKQLSFTPEEASSVELEITPGPARAIVVQAFNGDGVVVRRGATVLDVEAGKYHEVDMPLAQVPFFTNLRDGQQVSAAQLRPQIIAAPESVVQVEYRELGEGQSRLLADASLGRLEHVVGASGEVSIATDHLPAGDYEFSIRDGNGEVFHRVQVSVLAAEHMSFAAVSAAAQGVPCVRVDGVMHPRVLRRMCQLREGGEGL